MPWKETCAMSERCDFVEEIAHSVETLSAVCRRYGISRKTAYKWLARSREDPERGLEDRRGRRRFESRFDEEIRQAVRDMRNEHQNWGPEKLVAKLKERHPERAWPSPSTVKIWLRREGLSHPRRKRNRCPVQERTIALRPMDEPNAVWCMDFKGWFRTADRRPCEPLTLTDGCSRFLLACDIVPNRRCESVRPILETAFARYGIPQAIRSDNGAPFGSHGLGSLTPLSVWLLEQGVFPEKIRPGHPEENSRHERFHRTLKEEAIRPPAPNARLQQERFDRFRHFYNHERPHAALSQSAPAEHYRRSGRKPCAVHVYSASVELHKLDGNGYLHLRQGRVYLTESLAGRQVGLSQSAPGRWSLEFLGYPLGDLAEEDLRH